MSTQSATRVANRFQILCTLPEIFGFLKSEIKKMDLGQWVPVKSNEIPFQHMSDEHMTMVVD